MRCATAASRTAAVEAYREAMRLNPALPDIHNDLGTALHHAGRLAEAEAELCLALPDPAALMNLSSVQKERGSFAEAEATLRQALVKAPADPVLLYNWSLLLLLLGRMRRRGRAGRTAFVPAPCRPGRSRSRNGMANRLVAGPCWCMPNKDWATSSSSAAICPVSPGRSCSRRRRG